MSDTSQGPGWWIASDGKWYPPQTPAAPAPVGPPAGSPTAVPGAGPVGPPPAPAKGSNKGCITVLIIFGVIALVGIIAVVAGMAWLGHKVDSGEAFGKTSCDFASSEDVSDAMGEPYELIQLGGITALATPALDARVLSDGKTCWATPVADQSSSAGVVRIARYDGSDAASRYQRELSQAKGTTQDKGNGLQITTSGYLNKELSGVGDEAFCTTADLAGASGVLVRRGNELVYVSVGIGSSSTPSIDFGTNSGAPVKFGSDDQNCETAQKIAAKVG